MNLAQKGIITSVKQIAMRTTEVVIKVPADFNFIAGQYIWLQIPILKYPDVKGNTRMFSISSSPNKKGELGIVFRNTESGYNKTLTEIIPETEVIFSGPFGPLKLPENNSLPIVFLAGGIGVSPFLSMIRFSNENHSSRKIILIYVNTNEKEIVYLDELRKIEKENSNFKLYCTCGLLKERVLKDSLGELINQKVIWSVIGPKGFVDFVSKYLNEKGISPQDIIFEQFYPDPSLKND